ncbi:MAG: methyltransferase domain-containing protein, partial [Candidatus Hydrogenedentes bacterium]|nr:methyltransferase domain-containing protein [Candidatus Hydrogenedentota bacterium]
NRDLNMRVFEAMASGALLITDEADGLAELFEPGKHFVLYREDGELFELIEEYLKNDEARKGIADAGSTLVRSEHTYDRRAEQMLTMVLEALGVLSGGGESRFHFGGYYRSPRPELMQHIPTTARRVLDCGCGAGEFGRALKQRGVVEVVGIEVVERAWKMAKRVLDDALLGNIEHLELPFGDGYFDCICFGDVLEHLVDPAAVLRKVSRVLAPDGLIVMSIPNVRFCQVIAMLANGRWKYEDAGILDRTHLRFFTAPEMRELVQEAGLELVKLQPLSMLAPRQLPRQTDGTVALGRATLRPADDADYLDLLVYQYLVVAGKLQADPLARAQHALEANDNDEAYRLADSAIGANEAERKKIMAKAIARVGKLDRAEGLYREVLELSPFDTDSAREFGLVLVAAKRPDEARSFFDRALAANPDDDRAIAGLGLVSLLEGDSPTAFKQFRRALTINFDNEPLLDQFLLTATRLERLAEAEPILRRFVDFYPGRLEMACRYAELLHRLGRDSEAVERLDTLLLLVPEHERAAKLLNIIRKRPDETGA